MSRAATNVWLASLVAALGVIAAATLTASAGGKEVRRGGTLRLVYPEEGLGPDPQNGSLRTLGATQLTLYSFSNVTGAARLRPTAAAGLPVVSADGRTFTIKVRGGFRFSDGKPVTARNFAYAINRLLDPNLGSIWTYLFEDIVGARAVRERRASVVSGVKVRGDKLIVRLEQPRPDFLVRLTNPTISATPLDMPVVPGGVNTPAPSAGPYYLKEQVEKRRAVLARNPFWRRELLRWRPAHVDRIVFDRPGLSPLEAIRAVERDEIDLALAQGTPETARLARTYGINKGRLFVRQRLTFWYLAFNHERPLLRANPKLRRAINHALDRPALVRQWGPLAGKRTDQILPPGMPGFRDWDLYPLKQPNLKRARALAKDHLRGGEAVLYTYEAARLPFGPRVGEVVKFNLAQIGLDVDVKAVPGLNRRLVTPGEPWDIAVFGWFADYPDPFNFLNDLFTGKGIGRFADPVFTRRMRRAALLSGAERLAAYAPIERDLMRKAAPIAPWGVVNDVILVSKSIGCFGHDALSGPSLVALCKK